MQCVAAFRVAAAPCARPGGRPDTVSRRSAARGASLRAAASNTTNPRFALLFDCDGVIVETGARVLGVRACPS